MKLSTFLAEQKSIIKQSNKVDQYIFLEDFPTIASFLESEPMAKDVVDKVVDLVYNGNHSDALAYLEKEHQDLKDQIMALVYLQPHVAAKYDSNHSGAPLNTNES